MKKRLLSFLGLYLLWLLLIILVFYITGLYIWTTPPTSSVLKRMILFPLFLNIITCIIIFCYNKYIKKREKINYKHLLIGLITIIVLGISFCIVDYTRIKSGEMPIFVIAQHDKSGPEIDYYGLGYKVVRNPGVSHREQIYTDNYVKFGLWFYTWKIEMNKPSILYTHRLKTIETSNCNNKASFYYTLDNKKIYSYCLDSIQISNDGEFIELKNYLEQDENIVDEIINAITYKDSLFDGGTKIYKDGGTTEYTNNGITIINCHTLDGNRDIYIGPKNMTMQSNFCKNNNETFTRTYTIKDIEEYNEQQYEDGIPVTYGKSLKVTLSQFQAETKTVIINNLYDALEVNQTYEFEFMILNKDLKINDDIDSIFKYADIISTKKTDKVGLDQIQESIK